MKQVLVLLIVVSVLNVASGGKPSSQNRVRRQVLNWPRGNGRTNGDITRPQPIEPIRPCGQTTFFEATNVIASPNFPFAYLDDLDCTYTIETTREAAVSLHFQHFNIEEDLTCQYDWLMISCLRRGMPNPSYGFANQRLCGVWNQPETFVVSGCNSVVLTFHTDSSDAESGFEIRYSIQSDLSYNTGVVSARRCSFPQFDFSGYELYHCGVVVLLETGEKKLIHKGRNFERLRDIVIDPFDGTIHYEWCESDKAFNGPTVGHFVRAGGWSYIADSDNSIHACNRMMALP